MSNEILFANLDKNIQIKRCIIPQAVSITKNPDIETPVQIIERQNKFINLPVSVKEKLISYETGEKIQLIGTSFNLQFLQLADIARAIRSYYFGELKLEDMPAVLAKEIPIDLAKAQEISKAVIQKIINDDSFERAMQAKLVQMTISDALKTYPEIGEQLITSEKITLKNFPEPVRPCLKNWLSDFTFTLGHDKHTAMDRGIYLFQSANGKRLNSQDRNKLAYILKAFAENMPVNVNKDSKQIVFDSQSTMGSSQSETRSLKLENQNTQSAKFSTPGFSSAVHNAVRFSSSQRLPYENLKTHSYVTKPAMPRPEEKKSLPQNLVNLKDDY
jgi:hypothetical protein